MPGNVLSSEGVLEALRSVQDPELHRDLVSLGMTKDIVVRDGVVSLTVTLTTPACPLRESIQKDIRDAIAKLGGAREVRIRFDADVPAGRAVADTPPIPGVKNII